MRDMTLQKLADFNSALETTRASQNAKQWLPLLDQLVEQHLDIPVEQAAQFILKLASGQADELSGRFAMA